MNKTTKTIIKYFIEILIVAFGVFLGVYFSNINSDRKTETEKEKALQLIVNELKLNERLLEEQISYHDNIKEQFDSIMKTMTDETKNLSFTSHHLQALPKIKQWHGFNFAQIETTAFESAKISGIMKEFDIELLQKISNTYKSHDTYLKIGEKVLDKAFLIDSSSKISDFMAVINLMTDDLSGIEKRLKENIHTTIPELEHSESY